MSCISGPFFKCQRNKWKYLDRSLLAFALTTRARERDLLLRPNCNNRGAWQPALKTCWNISGGVVMLQVNRACSHLTAALSDSFLCCPPFIRVRQHTPGCFITDPLVGLIHAGVTLCYLWQNRDRAPGQEEMGFKRCRHQNSLGTSVLRILRWFRCDGKSNYLHRVVV